MISALSPALGLYASMQSMSTHTVPAASTSAASPVAAKQGVSQQAGAVGTDRVTISPEARQMLHAGAQQASPAADPCPT